MTESGKAKNRRAVVAGAEDSAGRARPFAARSAGRIYGRPRLPAGHALRSGRAVGAGEGSCIGSVSPFGVKVSEIHRAADDLLEPAIAEIAKDADGVEIERKVIEGSSAEALVNAVDMLAAGSAGTAGLPACCSAPSTGNGHAPARS
jgi:hypothetical protein